MTWPVWLEEIEEQLHRSWLHQTPNRPQPAMITRLCTHCTTLSSGNVHMYILTCRKSPTVEFEELWGGGDIPALKAQKFLTSQSHAGKRRQPCTRHICQKHGLGGIRVFEYVWGFDCNLASFRSVTRVPVTVPRRSYRSAPQNSSPGFGAVSALRFLSQHGLSVTQFVTRRAELLEALLEYRLLGKAGGPVERQKALTSNVAVQFQRFMLCMYCIVMYKCLTLVSPPVR